ncbi:hypothetical protein HanIR_Chr01g0026011 [Helianthus annuus]|nr:hypothetical protein HanIR_Chr01g0026011 [Helianthus annuus]
MAGQGAGTIYLLCYTYRVHGSKLGRCEKISRLIVGSGTYHSDSISRVCLRSKAQSLCWLRSASGGSGVYHCSVSTGAEDLKHRLN